MTHLHWLPEDPAWRARLAALRERAHGRPEDAWAEAVALANLRADFVRTNALDQTVQTLFGDAPPPFARRVRLALLGSCTLAHLHGAIRVGGLRRGIWVDLVEADYGQYFQALAGPDPALLAFAPDVILLALDAHHLAAGAGVALTPEQADQAVAEQIGHITECWRLGRTAFGCTIVQQTPLPLHNDLLGLNEHRLSGSPATIIARINSELRRLTAGGAEPAGVDLLSVDTYAARDGLASWHDPALWNRAKQEIFPAAAPLYGDLVARLLAARLGAARKCLVLDLDNTLWGGVIGDDGLDGIELGQGSPLGEAFVAFQRTVRNLSRRGVILAVCSKNDPAIAREPFERHPDMLLRLEDIACMQANWQDKAHNLRSIATALNIGLDSLVLIDDNPAERALVRQILPMVAVPEVTDDPDSFARAIADAGYFEAVALTGEDRARAVHYQSNRARDTVRASATNMNAYLRDLDMHLLWRPFDRLGVQRIVQLINKTNQFNLTTRRTTEAEIIALMHSDRAFGWQMRLIDRFGDNGVIAVCIARMQEPESLLIDTWLMSCRVLGRQIEQATLNLLAAQGAKLGAARLVGDYIPSARNSLVRDHYEKLGFVQTQAQEDGSRRFALNLARFVPAATSITLAEG